MGSQDALETPFKRLPERGESAPLPIDGKPEALSSREPLPQYRKRVIPALLRALAAPLDGYRQPPAAEESI
jgi:hypothetical protein